MKAKQTKRTCIFVLGMHRSGTSAITGLLKILGVELGSDLMQAWADNPKGFFENNNIWKFNQKLLEDFDSGWDDPFLYGPEWCSNHDLTDYKTPIRDLVVNEFSQCELFAIKDPRLCILYPLWQSIMEELEVQTVCIIPFRHPLEVAYSLKKRNNFSLERAKIMWLNHLLTAEKVSRNSLRACVEFNDLIIHTKSNIEFLAHELRIRFPHTFEAKAEQIGAFLDHELRHHTEQEFGSSEIEKLLANLYELLKQTAVNGFDEAVEHSFDDLRLGYGQLLSFFLNEDIRTRANCPKKLERLAQDLEFSREREASLEQEVMELERTRTALEQKNKQIEQELQTMRKTKAWRTAEALRKLITR